MSDLILETFTLTSTVVDGVLVEHARCIGADSQIYEWDFNTRSWKVWGA